MQLFANFPPDAVGPPGGVTNQLARVRAMLMAGRIAGGVIEKRYERRLKKNLNAKTQRGKAT